MATTVLGLKTFTASDPVDYNEINDNYNKIDNGLKTAMQGRAAHNWLDNSDMTNVINQRGASSYTGQVYGIDRWRGRAVAQTVSVRTADVTVTATGTSYAGIKQKVHGMPRLAGKTVTFAARLYANVVPELVLFDASEQSLAVKMGTSGATQTLILTYAVPTDATADSVVPTIMIRTSASGDYMRIVWAALYEGAYTADTLPAYQPKGFAAELAEAQRYYIHDMGRFTQGIIMPSGVLRVSYPVPTTMRTNPTVIVNNLDNAVVFSNGYSTVIALTACSFYNKKDNAILVDFSTNINAGDYKHCVATTYATSISLSADL